MVEPTSAWPGDQLVLAAQHGDETAIAALVSGAYPHIRRFASALCASSQDAEDAAQEAVLVLFRKIGSLRATAALGSWVFRIVRNECLRRAQLLTRRTVIPAAEFSPSAEDDVLSRLEVERVAAAVALRPEDQRRVLIMRDIQGLPGKTVAAALGLSTAAMKSRLHRARTTVRTHLDVIEVGEFR
ncbi:sigma-70 family RNA polymerase sigma factor [Nocardia brasiliensis]|uniref:Sigma-70 family RNA polymerase sigma factor n=1 Tax=Nocardia brasiliensis TaxID=37326 RepID=A0A6G9XMZ2_NOCBR|nr:RNA polymerase sigma factor [Nocardia brasiliensis]QIS02285.1 sigma-70 family RNA polymerase sigma factor [Nocardia brasiliensis]